MVSIYLLPAYENMTDFFHINLILHNIAKLINKELLCIFFGIFCAHIVCE